MVEGVIASLMWLLFLYNTLLTRFFKNTNASMVLQGEYCLNKTRNGKVDRRNATEVIVVGAGVAGSALAYTLGKEGRRVRVIKRDLNQPDKIVGELLQPEGYLKLLELGLQGMQEPILIDAQRVFSYVLYKNGKNTRLFYTLKHFQSDVAGRSFHNGCFIQRMRHKAVSLPNVSIEQGTVTSLIEENGTIKGVQYKTKGGRESKAYALLTIVCDNSFSNLRRSLCDPKVDVLFYFVSLVLENYELPYANHGHVILAYPSAILFYPISSTEIRCLGCYIPGQKVPSLSNGEMALYLKTVVAPQMLFISIFTLIMMENQLKEKITY
ncbi:Squalene monooxygenase [Gossypium australe]|uniref:Squalene monooxygenase n=1 Tax=Gossypium australe TaxID=47621 RepID=A0A5B6V8F2_9ROSI|nr:Squalene monooxygenase [Gossypium australe]